MQPDPPGNLWEATSAEEAPKRRFPAKESFDLVVIGGGITGGAAALAAAEAGARVCLLEAEAIGHGGSGRNVGLVNAGLWLAPDQIEAALGPVGAARLLAALGPSPDRVFELIDRHGITCAPRRAGTLHLAHSASGLRDLRARLGQQNRLGAPATLLDADDTARRTGAHGYHGALFYPQAGTIQPADYTRGLARAAAGLGACVVQHCPVKSVARVRGTWRVEAGQGAIMSRNVFVATNAYHRHLDGAGRAEFVPVHYFQMATAPLGEAQRAKILPGGEGCWDTALVMSSFRLDAAGRLIFGGIGNLEGMGRAPHAAWLRRRLTHLFPSLELPPIEFAWTGRIAMTGDHIPKILRIGPGALAAFGYSGRGIGPGTVFGTSAAHALLDEDESHLPIDPVPSHTEPFRGLRAAWVEAGATLAHLRP